MTALWVKASRDLCQLQAHSLRQQWEGDIHSFFHNASIKFDKYATKVTAKTDSLLESPTLRITVRQTSISGQPLEIANWPLNRGDRLIKVKFTVSMGTDFREFEWKWPLNRGLTVFTKQTLGDFVRHLSYRNTGEGRYASLVETAGLTHIEPYLVTVPVPFAVFGVDFR